MKLLNAGDYIIVNCSEYFSFNIGSLVAELHFSQTSLYVNQTEYRADTTTHDGKGSFEQLSTSRVLTSLLQDP